MTTMEFDKSLTAHYKILTKDTYQVVPLAYLSRLIFTPE